MPSHGGEGKPKAILEAAACGRPVITSDVPGILSVSCARSRTFKVPGLPRCRGLRAQKISFRRASSQIFRLIWSKRRWKCQLARLSRPVGVTVAIRRLGKVALKLEAKSSPEAPSKKMRCWFSSIMPVVVPCLRSSGNGAPVAF